MAKPAQPVRKPPRSSARHGGPRGPVTVATAREMAEVYDVSVRAVRFWLAEADWPGGRRGPYVLRGDLPQWIRRRAGHTPSPTEEKVAAARAGLVAERTRALVHARELREGLWLRTAEVAEAVVAYSQRFGAAVEAADRRFPGVADLIRKDLEILSRELRGKVGTVTGRPPNPAEAVPSREIDGAS